MRDVSSKYSTLRTAKAAASLLVRPETIEAIKSGKVPKADPIAVARTAGIQAAKQTSVIIPYCHQVPLDYVGIEIELKESSIEILSDVKAVWKTGVEMEALVAASATALTLYDMLKIIDDTMEVRTVRLLEKRGGKSALRLSGEQLKAGVLVVSDSVSAKKSEDRSGKLLAEELKAMKFDVVYVEVMPDDRSLIEMHLRKHTEKKDVDLILTTGGTGIGPRDVTPEATLAVIERRLEGVEEAIRAYGQVRLPTAMLSRSVAGTRGSTIIVNFPGSPGGVKDGMSAIFPALIHAFTMMRGEGHPAKG